MAVGLGLPEHFFDSLTDRSFWCARVIGYPALQRDQLNLSCGEHTDYGCWTLLAQAKLLVGPMAKWNSASLVAW